MQQHADKHCTDRPYRQHFVQKVLNQKLALKFFRSYRVVSRIRKVAYRLQRPQGSRIHPTFHVSQLKKHMGTTLVQLFLSVVEDQGSSTKELICIIDKRMVKCRNAATIEVLVEWANSFPKDAT
ncbi:Retrotransposable element Tf2 [Gossypium australe]|uniref:Retrotransposable element Tf2 n=1 Tax=Gossypium australe TaxID=47621 RepID=A0A5B6WVU7_9ROSI|nr:Retrotransposable element Tf2 [Gossypium australe]